MGNALAEASVRLAEMQEKAGNYLVLEHPATFLMRLYAPIAAPIAKATTFLVYIDVCMFGAPWRKPTTLVDKVLVLLKLRRCCDCQHEHIYLQGNTPCGCSWTGIASLYWPKFARELVRLCARLFVWEKRPGPSLLFAGFASVPAD